MKYIIREKLFTLANNFTIKDEDGKDRYRVKGRIFSIGKKLKIEDLSGRTLIEIEEKILKLLPTYKIYQNGKQVGFINKKISFLKPKYDISSDYGEFKIEGNIFKYNFNILKNRNIIARVDKKYLSIADSYMVDIDNNENQEFILALVIILDQIHHDNNTSKNNQKNTGE